MPASCLLSFASYAPISTVPGHTLARAVRDVSERLDGGSCRVSRRTLYRWLGSLA
jgi:hypothetical protein